MTLRVLIYQRDDYDKMFIRTDGIQDELEESTDDGVKFRVAVQFTVQILICRFEFSLPQGHFLPVKRSP
jgi:hypothetical protein